MADESLFILSDCETKDEKRNDKNRITNCKGNDIPIVISRENQIPRAVNSNVFVYSLYSWPCGALSDCPLCSGVRMTSRRDPRLPARPPANVT